jgi:hypothetical protein
MTHRKASSRQSLQEGVVPPDETIFIPAGRGSPGVGKTARALDVRPTSGPSRRAIVARGRLAIGKQKPRREAGLEYEVPST